MTISKNNSHMETNKFTTWCKNHAKLVGSLITAIAAIIVALLTASCGSTTRATIHNRASGTSTEVRITTNNPTSVSVSPTTEITAKSK